MNLSWITWNPPREIFTLPIINHPITWYGVCFVTGFVLGFFILVPILTKILEKKHLQPRTLAVALTDQLTWYIILGTIIGARLGHVFFYEWPHYQNNLLDILKVWEGGLASHGGTLGVLVALFLFSKKYSKNYPEISFSSLIDLLTIPTALVAFFIRIGNFINQEIIGPKTSVPWAIVFGNPYGGEKGVPRHPVQLYEAACYLMTFFILAALWNWKGTKLKKGFYFGLFMVLVFGSRFFLEFFKNPMSQVVDESFLQAGQWLSIPFILLGLAALLRPVQKSIPTCNL